MKRLAIITTHPVQYYAPFFKALSMQQGIQVKVYYTWGDASVKKFDPGFGREVEWDIPLLDGYDYQFLKNVASNPGSSHFKGIINPEAVKELQQFAPHALLVFGWAWHSHLRLIRFFHKRIKVWFRGDSTLLDGGVGVKAALRYLFLHWVYRHIDKAFYVGAANKLYFQKFGITQDRLKFAPHAIDIARFSADRNAEAKSMRLRLGIKEEEILVLFAGKFETKKRPDILLEAFLKINIPGLHLLFTGNGRLEQQLKQKAGQSEVVHFMPFQNQSSLPVVYQACDLFCLPSSGPGETWGLAVNEAMASGKAVLVSNKVGCAADLVQEGANGHVFEAGNVEDLKNKLSSMVSEKRRLQVMGRHSAGIIKNWSFEQQVRAVVEELEKL